MGKIRIKPPQICIEVSVVVVLVEGAELLKHIAVRCFIAPAENENDVRATGPV